MSDREVPTFYGHVDLDLWDDPASIVRYLRDASYNYPAADPDQRNVLRRLADQVEAQIRPLRIPEPGLWGVVDASCVHENARGPWVNDGLGWVRIGRDKIFPENHDDWDSLIDPVLIRPGFLGEGRIG